MKTFYTLTAADADLIQELAGKSRYYLMLKAYAKAKIVFDLKRQSRPKDEIKKALEPLSRICAVIYQDENQTEGLKSELHQEEELLYDYVINDKFSMCSVDEMMSWWNEWTNRNWDVCKI